ncbi:MAG: caspase family protein [Chloroflexi bacterium]|nr:caspase family protein [Chloroflexota bacterium]
MSKLYALLIGVDYYFPNRLPSGGSYPSLGGCVRDIRHVEAFLTERLQVPAGQILTLLASNTGNAQPPEPRDQWPTYENMVNQFKQLTTLAQPGDQVYIHYSGHGGRATTIYPDLKGINGLDETLVPTDIGNSEARYLRDVELYKLIQAMVDKQLVLTVVLDSCHSGGATRGLGGAVARGIPDIDTTLRPTASLVASAPALVATWQAAGGATRAAKPASGWLLEPRGYTLFAACRAAESAYEDAFDGREKNGALTYWLLDSLRSAGPDFSYQIIYDRILAKVHGRFEQQTPLLQGEGDRRVFGHDQIQPNYAVPVLEVDMANRRVRLNAGEVQGLQPGAQFALYPHGVTDFNQVEQRLAVVELTQVNAVDSWAKIVEQVGQTALEQGAQAVPLTATTITLQHGVAVVLEDAAQKGLLEATLASEGKGFVTLASADARVDFQVTINAQQAYEIWDPAGKPLANLRPAIQVNEPDAARKVVRRLVHLAKYRNVQLLDMPDPSWRQKLNVSLAGAASTESVAIFHPDDKVKLTITNTQSRGAINDPRLILNITVLDLGPDWSITQVYPALSGSFESLDPGESKTLDFDAFLPEGYAESVDTLKIFATRGTTQFHWLTLPALDQPAARQATRDLITDPLEQLLATVTDEAVSTRAIRLTNSSPDKGWTVAQVELRVQPKN